MSLQEQLAEFVLQTSANPLAQQLAPLVVVISCVVFPLVFRSSIYAFSFSVINMLDYLYNLLSWSSAHSSGKDSVTSKRPRTRAEQVRERNRQAIVDTDQSGKVNDGYYAGLVNISGTYCFMNSTLQAFASLQSLLPYLDEVHAQAEACDVPSPITDTLRELLRALNDPQPYPRAIRPDAIISALSHPEPGKRSPLFTSREHQDAQELFQLVSELVKKEANAVDLDRGRDRGLGFVLDFEDEESDEAPEVVKLSQKTVFDGLTANRRSCLECGYTEAVMHFSFNSWQLPLPRTTTCRLEECLTEYTKLEVLTDCICRRCSMDATLARLEEDTERLAADSKPSNSRKKALRDARKLRARVEAALKEGRVEDDIKGLKISRVFSRASTKQAIVARPPRVLALHLNRSMTYGAYASKNSVYVVFSEILDLSPFATAGALSTRPESPISPPGSPRIPVLYRLAAVVCHYGTHQFGHYIAFRRKPPLHPPQLASMSPTGELLFEGGRTVPGKGWLRISDDSVSECGLESALAEGSGAFMLYYERVQLPQAPTDPEMAPAAMTSRASSVPRRGARILRSVSAGWSSPSDSSSVSSSSRDTSVTSAEDDEHRATPHNTLKTVASIEGCVAGDEGLSLPSDGVVLSEEP